jgi:hypothetical protein
VRFNAEELWPNSPTGAGPCRRVRELPGSRQLTACWH